MLRTKNLVKTFFTGGVTTPVLRGIDLTIPDGEFLAIMGRSGAGKSTLMYQLSLLDEPTEGEIHVDGHEAHSMTEHEKVHFRLKHFGYVFQDYALLPELTALENVMLPILMERYDEKLAQAKATDALAKVGLDKRLGNLPSQLSGGEQQRVSIARAIAHKPAILFADEPTANLDRVSAQQVMEIFKELHAAKQTIVMVTHEEEYGALAERIIHIDEGKIVSEHKPPEHHKTLPHA